MTMPKEIRQRIKARLWSEAERLDWVNLPDGVKAAHYERWTRDSDIGGTLSHFMDPRRVRVYMKDTLLKPYLRERLARLEIIAKQRIGVDLGAAISERYIKPHGLLFENGNMIGWGMSRDWKLILLTVFERCRQIENGNALGVLLIESGRVFEDSVKALVSDAASKLEIGRVEWIQI